MKTSFNINIKMFLIIVLLVGLFPTCIYSMQKKDKIPSEVIIGGELLQININTNKVMYYRNENENNGLENYDLICNIDGKSINNREDIFKYVSSNKKDENVEVIVLRNNEYESIYLKPSVLKPSFFTEYIPFSATLTYINPEDYSFGAVGHNINIPNVSNVLTQKGDIYLCNTLEIKKSNTFEVGTIHGKVNDFSLGKVNKVNKFGAKGNINLDNFKDKQVYEVSKADEVKLGSASLVINNTNEVNKKFYEINITKVNKQKKPSTQGFEFEIVDKDFIKEYGGILQGMSGAPIVQNGKIIGALSHVIATNPKNGIGLYIEWMMEK